MRSEFASDSIAVERNESMQRRGPTRRARHLSSFEPGLFCWCRADRMIRSWRRGNSFLLQWNGYIANAQQHVCAAFRTANSLVSLQRRRDPWRPPVVHVGQLGQQFLQIVANPALEPACQG